VRIWSGNQVDEGVPPVGTGGELLFMLTEAAFCECNHADGVPSILRRHFA
jgi:hypothetical protein